jgi:CubicO group peptidase (beta-lactamase class C family)
MLFGAAIFDGHVDLDGQVVKYVPEMVGTCYDGVTVRNILQMSSGVDWNYEDLGNRPVSHRLIEIVSEGGVDELLELLARLPRAAEPGRRYSYSNGEALLAGVVLARAVGTTLGEYLAARVWGPYGMRHDAYWRLLGRGDLERGAFGLSTTLPDLARIGSVALRGGADREGHRLFAPTWMKESTAAAPEKADFGSYWWLSEEGRSYFASGLCGQHLEVFPEEELVVAIHSCWPVAGAPELHRARMKLLLHLRDVFAS